MNKKLIIFNLKMNLPVLADWRKIGDSKAEVVVCPPFVFLEDVSRIISRSRLGAQDVFWANSARATGEVSPEMLKDLGASYCIIGHSERRALGETDDSVSKKLRAALAEGLTPIVCVGEKERDAEGRYFGILKAQLTASFSGITRAQFRDISIAYEPLWAIGKSAREAAEPRVIREMSIFIQKVLSDLYGEEAARLPRILYGGSVKPDNVKELMAQPDIDGGLVGGASLQLEEFASIVRFQKHVGT